MGHGSSGNVRHNVAKRPVYPLLLLRVSDLVTIERDQDLHKPLPQSCFL